MRVIQAVILALLVAVLSACQTIPLYETNARAFAPPANENRGAVRVTGFHIPKDEPVTTFMLVLAAVGGANINQPISASVFDVTEETRYIGTLGLHDPGHWLETDMPAGKRTLMLTLAGSRSSIFVDGLGSHADFIEVDVKARGVTHVALSRYGFTRYPYLGEVTIADQHREHCQGLTGKRSERRAAIERYMADHGISQHADDFKGFCLVLSDHKLIQTPNAEGRKQFAEKLERIDALRKETYAKWKSEAEKRTPYDLMRSYERIDQQAR